MDGPGYRIVMSANSELDERLGEEDLPRQWCSRCLDDLLEDGVGKRLSVCVNDLDWDSGVG